MILQDPKMLTLTGVDSALSTNAVLAFAIMHSLEFLFISPSECSVLAAWTFLSHIIFYHLPLPFYSLSLYPLLLGTETCFGTQLFLSNTFC